MLRFWIGLAMALWFGTQAFGADDPHEVPPLFPPALTAPITGGTSNGKTAPPSPPLRTFARSDVPPTSSAPPSLPPTNHEPWRTRVWRLCNAPATQLSQTLATLFSAEQRAGHPSAAAKAVIVPEVVSNSLIVAGPSEGFEEISKLIEALDRALVMIRIEVVMGDVPTADLPAAEAGAKADANKVRASAVGVEEARKRMDVLFRAQLTTLDNQPASLQAGRVEPTIMSVAITSANPTMGYGYGAAGSPPNSRSKPPAMETNRTNAVMPQNLGTLLRFTPRANADRVVAMQLDINDSRFAPASEGVPIFEPAKGDPIRAPVTEMLTLQTTIKVADGQTLLLSDMSRQAKNGKQRVVLVTVHVLPVGDQPKP